MYTIIQNYVQLCTQLYIYNEQWNVFSAFNPSKCTHTWSSGQPTVWHPGSSWGFSALLKGLTSVVDTSCQSWDSNPQPWVTSGFKSNALSIRPRLPHIQEMAKNTSLPSLFDPLTLALSILNLFYLLFFTFLLFIYLKGSSDAHFPQDDMIL